MTPKLFPQSILLRLSDVSDANVSTGHRAAYVTTTLASIVQGLRNLECQPDPFNEFQGPDALFTRLLAGIVGTTEYDAVMGNDVERLNALLAEQVEQVESLRQDVATLTRERDKARAETIALALALDPVNRAQDEEGSTHLQRVNQLAAFARKIGFPNAEVAFWDEADDDKMSKDDIEELLFEYGPGEGTTVAFGLIKLGAVDYTVLPSDDEDGEPFRYAEDKRTIPTPGAQA